MDTLATSTGLSDPDNSEANLREQLQQAQLRQTQVETQLQAQLLKQAKGPSVFRKVLGAVAGGGASLFAPGLGGAIGSMIMGGNRPLVIPPGALPGTGPAALTPDANAGLDKISQVMQQNHTAMEKITADAIQRTQDEMAELAAAPKGLDPVPFLAWQEKTSEQSEIFQATSAVAKAKHEAAMAAIQNIKD